jgi:signal transduction histidine kinase
MAMHEEFSQLDLLVHMTHEMRTPLNAILGFAQLMESGTPSPTDSQLRSIDMILQAGWQLEKLITVTRDLALIESGTLSLSLDAVPLAAVMLDCQSMIESKARLRGVHVSFPTFETPCFVSADRDRLQQAMGHLLSAAIDNREAQGGAVVVDCDTRGAKWLRIGIHDGAGESLAERPTPLPQRAAGMDIGLLLAKRLVESMGGVFGTECIGPNTVVSLHLQRIPNIPFNASETPASTAMARHMT